MEYSTKKHFSYYKFYISDNMDNFKLYISNCTIKHQIKVSFKSLKDVKVLEISSLIRFVFVSFQISDWLINDAYF